MPDTSLETNYDLRQPQQRIDLKAAVAKFAKAKKKNAFTCRETAEGCECNMSQARGALNALIADEVLTYEGATRDMTYSNK